MQSPIAAIVNYALPYQLFMRIQATSCELLLLGLLVKFAGYPCINASRAEKKADAVTKEAFTLSITSTLLPVEGDFTGAKPLIF